jgi:hypothetical protein
MLRRQFHPKRENVAEEKVPEGLRTGRGRSPEIEVVPTNQGAAWTSACR